MRSKTGKPTKRTQRRMKWLSKYRDRVKNTGKELCTASVKKIW